MNKKQRDFVLICNGKFEATENRNSFEKRSCGELFFASKDYENFTLREPNVSSRT